MLSFHSYTVIIKVLVAQGYCYISCTVGLCADDRQTTIITQQLKSSRFTYTKTTNCT